MIRRSALQSVVVVATLSFAHPHSARGQISWGVQATPLITRADPIPGNSSLTELRVVAPLLYAMLPLAGGHVMVHAMLDGEGLTMAGGELATGDWGEGFVDRRHPHTWLHELLVTGGASHWSLTAGKGFAPFGTDDPMSRPAVVYPVNHHWSQILERVVTIGALRWRAVTLEGGLFNGDEPEHWNQWPNWDRFADSWSTRLTVRPASAVELGASYANVKSPEHRQGAGLGHQLLNVSARVERHAAVGDVYALAEWDRASEDGFFVYYSGLLEAQIERARGRFYLRIERTDRPEELRLSNDDFRGIRPHSENSNLGITRWNVVTAGVGRRLAFAHLPVRFEAIGEAAYLHVTSLTGVFDPATWYGRNDLWMLSVGLRIGAGGPLHRMGRYGAAMPDASHPMTDRMPE